MTKIGPISKNNAVVTLDLLRDSPKVVRGRLDRKKYFDLKISLNTTKIFQLDSSTAQCRTGWLPCRVKIPHRKAWLTPTARVPCSNAANIGQRKTWTQSEYCTWQNSVRGKSPQNAYIMYQPRKQPNIVQSLVDLR